MSFRARTIDWSTPLHVLQDEHGLGERAAAWCAEHRCTDLMGMRRAVLKQAKTGTFEEDARALEEVQELVFHVLAAHAYAAMPPPRRPDLWDDIWKQDPGGNDEIAEERGRAWLEGYNEDRRHKREYELATDGLGADALAQVRRSVQYYQFPVGMARMVDVHSTLVLARMPKKDVVAELQAWRLRLQEPLRTGAFPTIANALTQPDNTEFHGLQGRILGWATEVLSAQARHALRVVLHPYLSAFDLEEVLKPHFPFSWYADISIETRHELADWQRRLQNQTGFARIGHAARNTLRELLEGAQMPRTAAG